MFVNNSGTDRCNPNNYFFHTNQKIKEFDVYLLLNRPRA